MNTFQQHATSKQLQSYRRHLLNPMSEGPIASMMLPSTTVSYLHGHQHQSKQELINTVLHVIEQDAHTTNTPSTSTINDLEELFNPRPMNPNKRMRVVDSLTMEESLAHTFKEQPDNVALVRQVFNRSPLASKSDGNGAGTTRHEKDERLYTIRSKCEMMFDGSQVLPSALVSPVPSVSKSGLVGNKRKIVDIEDDFLEIEVSFSPSIDGHDSMTGDLIIGRGESVVDTTAPALISQESSSVVSDADSCGIKIVRDVDTSSSVTTKKEEECKSQVEIDSDLIDWDSAFRPYQSEQWYEKYEELCEFHRKNGHCGVPPSDAALYRWLKRQRHQFRLKKEGKPSPISDDRIAALDKVGISWDPQGDLWMDRLTELRDYLQVNGHCNVPSRYPPNAPLSTWVKCQRRQYKLFKEGKNSNITQDRIDKLIELGFVFAPRAK